MKSSVRAKWLVRLGPNSKSLVKVGDVISEGQELMVETKEVIKSFDINFILSKVRKELIEAMVLKWNEKPVNIDDVLLETGGFMSKKLMCPECGIFSGIDEFGNLKIRIKEGHKHIVVSPVAGKIVKIDKEKITLEFQAFEIKGKGIVEGKCWGNSDLKPIEKISDLDYQSEESIVMSCNIDKSFITKAEVIGVNGIIMLERGDECVNIESALPILAVNQKDWEVLLTIGQKLEKEARILLNAKLERLLIVKS